MRWRTFRSARESVVEVRASAEGAVLSQAELAAMTALAKGGIAELVALQRQALA